MKVSDPSGIRRVEIFDVTGAPHLVGAEDYAGGVQTDRGATCCSGSPPCPQLCYGETLRPASLPAGRRKLIVRAYDAGGNLVDRGPYEAEVASPSDRGALNGAGATEGGQITARFTRGTTARDARSASSEGGVAGQLLNAAGMRLRARASPCSRATSTTTTRSCAPM